MFDRTAVELMRVQQGKGHVNEDNLVECGPLFGCCESNMGNFADEREGRSTLSEGTAAVIGGRKPERRSNDKSPDSRRPTERPKSGHAAEPVRRGQST